MLPIESADALRRVTLLDESPTINNYNFSRDNAMKVLAAISNPESSKAALLFLTSRSWPLETEFLILSVTEPHITDFGICFPPQETRAHTRMVGNLVRAVRRILPEHTATARIEIGSPAETIAEIAKEWQADLIVMGSGSDHSLEESSPTHLMERLMIETPCPIELASDYEMSGSIGSSKFNSDR